MEVVAFPQVRFVVGPEPDLIEYVNDNQQIVGNTTKETLHTVTNNHSENYRVQMNRALRNLLLSFSPSPDKKIRNDFDTMKFEKAFGNYKLLGSSIGKPLSENGYNRGYSVNRFQIDPKTSNFQIHFNGPFGEEQDFLITDYEGKMIKLGNPKLPNIYVVRDENQEPHFEYRQVIKQRNKLLQTNIPVGEFRLGKVPYSDLFRIMKPVRQLVDKYPNHFENLTQADPFANGLRFAANKILDSQLAEK